MWGLLTDITAEGIMCTQHTQQGSNQIRIRISGPVLLDPFAAHRTKTLIWEVRHRARSWHTWPIIRPYKPCCTIMPWWGLQGQSSLFNSSGKAQYHAMLTAFGERKRAHLALHCMAQILPRRFCPQPHVSQLSVCLVICRPNQGS